MPHRPTCQYRACPTAAIALQAQAANATLEQLQAGAAATSAPSHAAAAACFITQLEQPPETPLGQPADYLDEFLECLARDDEGHISGALGQSLDPSAGHLGQTIGGTDVGAALVPMPSSMVLRDLLS